MPQGLVQYAFIENSTRSAQVHIGKITGGARNHDEKAVKREGIFGAAEWKGGPLEPEVSYQCLPEAAEVWAYILRAAGSYPRSLPTGCYLNLGDDGDATDYDTYYCHEATIGVAVGEAASLDQTFRGIAKPAEVAAHTSTVPARGSQDTTYEWYQGSLTLGASPYDMSAVTCTIGNNFLWKHTGDAKGSGDVKRLPDGIDIGHETGEATITFLADPGIVFHADDLARATVVLVMTNGDDTQTLTLTSWATTDFRRGIQVGSLIQWEVDIKMDDNTAAQLTLVSS